MKTAQKDAVAERAPGPEYPDRSKYTEEFKLGGLNYVSDKFDEYGPIVEIKMEPQSLFLIRSPSAIRRIFIENAKNYTKGKLFEILKIVGGNGLFFSDGAFWLQNRRIIGPYFKASNMKYYVNAVVASGDKSIEYVETRYSGHEFDAGELAARVALYVVGKAFFGMEFEEPRLDALLKSVQDSAKFGQSLLESEVPDPSLPTEVNINGKAALDVMYGTIDQLISEAAAREKGEDLLSLLLSSVEDGGMTREHLKDEMWTIVNAGHETTATTMALMLYHLGKDQAWQEELFTDIDTILEGRDPTFADLPRLEKMDWTTKETLRLYPPAPSTARQAVDDDVIDGYLIPKGSIVQPQFYFVQRDPRFWDEPERFIPRRFSAEASADRPEYAYSPFGAGGRRCLGEHFAYLEALIIVTKLLQHYRVETRADFEVEPYQALALRMRNGMKITLHKR